MFGSLWQIIRGVYTLRRSGMDKGNVEHVRVDLRFRLAMVEYAYFGRSGRRVVRCLGELKSVLGEKGVHRYLRTLDPDLRTQFVERFQGARRSAGAAHEHMETPPATASTSRGDVPRAARHGSPSASNVVPFQTAVRRGGVEEADGDPNTEPRPSTGTRSMDSGE